ncbi:MAG: hypothetical protein CVV61_08415 [Tenericutes bacterium HGW-Tenericutes-6]|nr:MAG: hypothetical protein CVV61_08415 [Tenericutes bacterium HGW-Tenericutes-6]
MDLVFATNNKHKLQEVKHIIGDRFNIKIISRDYFKEFRASVPDLDDAIIPIHNLRDLQTYIKRGIREVSSK